MKKICFVTSSPMFVNFFLVQYLTDFALRYRVFLVVNLKEGTPLKPLPGVEIIYIPIRRKTSPLFDLYCFVKLYFFFRAHHFDAIHSYSPKAGFLSMLAGWVARVPRRVHTYTGQIWVTHKGAKRWLFRCVDRLIAKYSTQLLADSPSQHLFLVQHGVLSCYDACRVLGSGSISGVDVQRFKFDLMRKRLLRDALGIPYTAKVVLFLGRITRDKGILELLEAFSRLSSLLSQAYLVLVGPDEEGLVADRKLLSSARIRVVGYTDFPEHYLTVADLLVLPSHREGFGSVVLEAAAMGIPAVAASVYGITDAIVDGVTGLLHAVGDVDDLTDKLELLLRDNDLRELLGRQALERVLKEFSHERLLSEFRCFYKAMLCE